MASSNSINVRIAPLVEAGVGNENGDQGVDAVPGHEERLAEARTKRPAHGVEHALFVVGDLCQVQVGSVVGPFSDPLLLPEEYLRLDE